MNHTHCYSTRRLNPFRGTIQIVSTEQARATSTDGVCWRIQIRRDIYKTPWSSLAIPEQHDCCYAYGNWTAEKGLVRIPIHPSLYEEHIFEAVDDLITRLKLACQHLPFAPEDTLELWLMNSKCDQPVALLASQLAGDDLAKPQQLRWYVSTDAETALNSRMTAEAGSNSTNRLTLQACFDRATRLRCNTLLTAYWIERRQDNSGVILQDHTGKPVSQHSSLPASAFPACLLAEDWADVPTRHLARDYLNWQAPLLLMLPLPGERRRALERDAQQHPLLVQRYHRLYPGIEDPVLLKKILVEAVMRTATANHLGRNNDR